MTSLLRRRPRLSAAAAILFAGGVMLSAGAVSQEGQTPDAQPAPAPAAPAAAPAASEQPPSAGVSEEAPPSAEAPLAAANDPAAAAEEDRLTAALQAEAASAPAAPPPRRRAPRAGAVAGADVVVGPVGDRVAEVAPVLPRQRMQVAVLQGLDKTTARTLRFYAPVGQAVRYEGLVVTARACEASNPEEVRQDNFAYLEILSQPRPSAGRPVTQPRRVYQGWMSAEAPTVHPFGHPAYDVWLVECRTSAPAREGGA